MKKTTQPKSDGEKFDAWIKRTAKKFASEGGTAGVRFVRPRGQNPLVDVANEVFEKAARRKIN
jgi:hypothetical protein